MGAAWNRDPKGPHIKRLLVMGVVGCGDESPSSGGGEPSAQAADAVTAMEQFGARIKPRYNAALTSSMTESR